MTQLPTSTRQVVLASRPQGAPSSDNFRLETVDLPQLADGEVLVRNVVMSLDPYMRGRMSDAPSYAPPVQVGDTMVGATVSRVLQSQDPSLAEGDVVAVLPPVAGG